MPARQIARSPIPSDKNIKSTKMSYGIPITHMFLVPCLLDYDQIIVPCRRPHQMQFGNDIGNDRYDLSLNAVQEPLKSDFIDPSSHRKLVNLVSHLSHLILMIPNARGFSQMTPYDSLK